MFKKLANTRAHAIPKTEEHTHEVRPQNSNVVALFRLDEMQAAVVVPVQFDHYDNYSEVYLAFVQHSDTETFKAKLGAYNEKQAYDLFYDLGQRSELENKRQKGGRLQFEVDGRNWAYAGGSVFSWLHFNDPRPTVKLEKIKARSQFEPTHPVIQLEARVALTRN